MSRSIIGACAAALTFAATAAVAGPPAPPSRMVTYADLNLSTDPGAGELLKRLDQAAWQVCRGAAFGRQDLEAARELQACRRQAVEAAVRTVGSERLAGALAVRVTRPPAKARLAKAD